MKIEQVKLDALIPYARNSRTHSDAQVAQIAASIKEFGFTNPVLIDETGSIIAGHGRVMAARKLAIADVPSIRLTHLTEAQKKAYVIADNKLALNAGWDDEMLAVELTDLKDMGFDLDLTGFNTDEIEALLAPTGTEGLTDEDAVPEVPEAPVTVLGDVWLLGKHRVMCGDSTSIDAVEKLMDGQKAELCFTSPPYSDQREYGADKDLSVANIVKFISTAYGSVNYFVINLGISRKDGALVRYWDDYINEAEACGLSLISWNVWDKGECGSIGNQTAMFGISHEWIFVFGAAPKVLNRTVENINAGYLADHNSTRQSDGSIKKGKNRTVSAHSQLKTIYQCSPQKARDDIDHPARFPVEFASGYVEAMTNVGQCVYEPFGGSGSTLIACEKTGRINRSMELDPKYCDVIVQRWQEFTGQTATLESNGKPFISLKKAA